MPTKLMSGLNKFSAFKKIIELTKPVLGSQEIWFKLGPQKVAVAKFDRSGKFPIWETKLKNSNDSKSRILTQKHHDAYKYLRSWSEKKSGGISFIPSQPQGFPLKNCIEVSDSIAVEFDDIPLEKQQILLDDFARITGLQPAYIIFSGNKSYHAHWKTNEHIDVEKIVYLRRLMAIALSSDYSIANIHQPLRMAGFLRRETGKEQTLIEWSDRTYQYEDFITRIKKYFSFVEIPFPESLSEDRWRKWKQELKKATPDTTVLTKPEPELFPAPPKRNVTIDYLNTNWQEIPLEKIISVDNQKILLGVESHRNETGFALAANLIAWDDWLSENNFAVVGDPYDIFIDYCRGCKQGGGWNQIEWDSIWKSARRINPQLSNDNPQLQVHFCLFYNNETYRSESIAAWMKANKISYLEPDREEYQAYIEREKELIEIETIQQNSEFFEWLINKVNKFGKKVFKGFKKSVSVSLPKTIEYDPKIPLPSVNDYQGKNPPRIIFDINQRHEVINKLRDKGWLTILDRSFMGLGKSHDMGLFENYQGTYWYLDLNHRNPTVRTVEENCFDLTVRHNGLFKDETRHTPLGQPHLIWAGEGAENPDIQSCCINAHLFNRLNQKGYLIDDFQQEEDNKINKICANCPFHKWKVTTPEGDKRAICASEVGDGYGFRYLRQIGLAHQRIRANINSLPGTSEYNYSDDIAVVEEAGLAIDGTTSVTADIKDLATKILEIYSYPELADLLKPLFDVIKAFLNGEIKLPYYGLNHEQIVSKLPLPPQNIEEIVQKVISITPCFEDIFINPDRVPSQEKQWRNAAKTANKYFNKIAKEETVNNISKLPSNFLLDLLEIWGGLKLGALRITANRQLIITKRAFRHGEILNEMAQTILLDATGNKKYLAQKLNISENAIIEIEQKLPSLKNVTLVNCHVDGLKSSQYSAHCLDKLTALKQYLEKLHPSIPVLGLKKYSSQLDLQGWWFKDNRGSNAFKSMTAMAAFGTPKINLGVAEDRYLTMCGDLEGFEDYYNSLIEAEILQLIGRPRAHLYPDRQFIIYLVNSEDYDFSYLQSKYGINVINRHGFELCPEAGNLKQLSQYKFLNSIASLYRNGSKATYRTIAKSSGLSSDYIKSLSRELGGIKTFKKWVFDLLDTYRSNTQINDIDRLLDDAKIKQWLKIDSADAIAECLSIIHDCGWENFRQYLEYFSLDIQTNIWGLIAPVVLPASFLEKLNFSTS